MKYTIKTEEGVNSILYKIKTEDFCEITIECFDDSKLEIKGPQNILSKAIGGRGEERGDIAWITSEHIKTEAESASAVLEILSVIQNS